MKSHYGGIIPRSLVALQLSNGQTKWCKEIFSGVILDESLGLVCGIRQISNFSNSCVTYCFNKSPTNDIRTMTLRFDCSVNIIPQTSVNVEIPSFCDPTCIVESFDFESINGSYITDGIFTVLRSTGGQKSYRICHFILRSTQFRIQRCIPLRSELLRNASKIHGIGDLPKGRLVLYVQNSTAAVSALYVPSETNSEAEISRLDAVIGLKSVLLFKDRIFVTTMLSKTQLHMSLFVQTTP